MVWVLITIPERSYSLSHTPQQSFLSRRDNLTEISGNEN